MMRSMQVIILASLLLAPQCSLFSVAEYVQTGLGISCDSACASLSMDCDLPAILLLIGDKTAVENAIADAGGTCTYLTNWGYDSGPGICSSPAVGQKCDLPAIQDIIGSQESMHFAVTAAGGTCTSFVGWAYNTGPGICSSESCCGGDCVGICTYGGTADVTCAASSGSYSRICACKACPDCVLPPPPIPCTSECCSNLDCEAPTPICAPDGSGCTAQRWVEPSTHLPTAFTQLLDTREWTKYVRAVIPIMGKELTTDAALFEMAYFMDNVLFPGGVWNGHPGFEKGMLMTHPTRVSVFPACPNAWMHPAVKPEQSSGGGAPDNTLVTEDWVLRYPKCAGALAVKCSSIPLGTLCNNCGWANGDPFLACNDTIAHEASHTFDMHVRNWLNETVDSIARDWFPSNPGEWPAWAGSSWFMNPSEETGQSREDMTSRAYAYLNTQLGFRDDDFKYVRKDLRCPSKGLQEACDDSTLRTYRVPLDD
eukprot:gene24245-9841_t